MQYQNYSGLFWLMKPNSKDWKKKHLINQTTKISSKDNRFLMDYIHLLVEKLCYFYEMSCKVCW